MECCDLNPKNKTNRHAYSFALHFSHFSITRCLLLWKTINSVKIKTITSSHCLGIIFLQIMYSAKRKHAFFVMSSYETEMSALNGKKIVPDGAQDGHCDETSYQLTHKMKSDPEDNVSSSPISDQGDQVDFIVDNETRHSNSKFVDTNNNNRISIQKEMFSVNNQL